MELLKQEPTDIGIQLTLKTNREYPKLIVNPSSDFWFHFNSGYKIRDHYLFEIKLDGYKLHAHFKYNKIRDIRSGGEQSNYDRNEYSGHISKIFGKSD